MEPIILRDESGQAWAYDRYNQTVTAANGRKTDALAPGGLHTRAPLTPADVHPVASVMGNFVAGYGTNRDQMIADVLAPPLVVDEISARYMIDSSNNLFYDVNDDIAGDTAPLKEVSPVLSSSTYACIDYGLVTTVSRNVELKADTIGPRMAALRRLANASAIRRERRGAAILLDGTTTFASYKTTLVGTAKWNGGTASDPVANLFTAMETAVKEITHIGMSLRTWHDFLQNPNVQKHSIYKAGTNEFEQPNVIASRIGLEGVSFVIGKMRYKAPSGGAMTWVWGNDVICLHVPQGAGQNEEDIPSVRNFRFNAPGSTMGWEIREWDDPNAGQRGSRKIALVTSEVVVATGADTAHLIVSAHQ